MRKKSVPPAGYDQESIKLATVAEGWRTVRTLIRTAGVVASIYLVFRALTPFAGRQTAVDVALSLVADFKFALSVILGGLAAAWAVVERLLRYRKTEYLQNRIKALESRFDADRSSSGLTPKGQTNPKDRRR